MEWIMTDFAGPSKLGSKERLQHKKNLCGEHMYIFVCELKQ